MSKQDTAHNQISEDTSSATGGRRPYESPLVRKLGDIRGLTLGGTPGNLDSGGADPLDPQV